MKREVSLFCDRLRMHLARVEAVDLALLQMQSAPCRTDMLFELGADLSDTLVSHAAGRVNETVVREAAVAVAVEAMKLWLASCGLGSEETTHGR